MQSLLEQVNQEPLISLTGFHKENIQKKILQT